MLTGQGHDRTFWSGVNILYLNLVMVTWVYTFVRTHQAILLRSVCFTLWDHWHFYHLCFAGGKERQRGMKQLSPVP